MYISNLTVDKINLIPSVKCILLLNMLYLLTSETPDWKIIMLATEKENYQIKPNPVYPRIKKNCYAGSNVLMYVLVEMDAEAETKLITLIENENTATNTKNIACKNIKKVEIKKYEEHLSRNVIQSKLEMIK